MANKKKKPSFISRGTYRVLLFLVRTFTRRPTIEGWENNSRLAVCGNSLMLVVMEDADAIVESFEALFA